MKLNTTYVHSQNMIPFSLVRTTEPYQGVEKGVLGRIYCFNSNNTVELSPLLAESNINDPVRYFDSIDIDISCIEHVSNDKPSNFIMDDFAGRFREIILDEMKRCLEQDLILNRVSALGTLFDIVTFRKPGWEEVFWKLYVETFAPKQKKPPKSARKLGIVKN